MFPKPIQAGVGGPPRTTTVTGIKSLHKDTEQCMRNLDFSSWQTLASTLLGLAVITLIGVGIRLLVMQTVQ
jgi:hypothetical protein